MQRLKWQNARNSSIKNNYSSKNEIEKKIPHAFTISADNRIHGTFLSTLFICLESISFERIFPFSHSLVYAAASAIVWALEISTVFDDGGEGRAWDSCVLARNYIEFSPFAHGSRVCACVCVNLTGGSNGRPQLYQIYHLPLAPSEKWCPN